MGKADAKLNCGKVCFVQFVMIYLFGKGRKFFLQVNVQMIYTGSMYKNMVKVWGDKKKVYLQKQ